MNLKMPDARANIVTTLELYEGRELMSEKEFLDEYGATTTTTLRLTAAYHGTGRIIVADSWFGSLKNAIALMKRGLYCNRLVKTAHKGFPRELLNQTDLSRGEWAAYAADVEGVRVQVNNCKIVLQIHLSQRHSTIFPCKTLSMLLYRNKFHESKMFIFLFCCYLGC